MTEPHSTHHRFSFLILAICFLTIGTLVVPSGALSCLQRGNVEFEDFFVEAFVLFDRGESRYDSGFIKSFSDWLDHLADGFGEFRVATATFFDDKDHGSCYEPVSNFTKDRQSWRDTMLANFKVKPSSERKTAGLSGALDAIMDDRPGWEPLDDTPPRRRIPLRVAFILTNKEPMLKGSFPGRPEFSTTTKFQCGQSDGPSSDDVTGILLKTGSHMFVILEKNDSLEKSWGAVAKRRAISGSGHKYDAIGTFEYSNRTNIRTELTDIQRYKWFETMCQAVPGPPTTTTTSTTTTTTTTTATTTTVIHCMKERDCSQCQGMNGCHWCMLGPESNCGVCTSSCEGAILVTDCPAAPETTTTSSTTTVI